MYGDLESVTAEYNKMVGSRYAFAVYVTQEEENKVKEMRRSGFLPDHHWAQVLKMA